MKHGILTKLTAVLVLALMLCVSPLSVFAAADNAGPVIFIPDMTEIVLYQNPNSLNGERAVFNPTGDAAKKHAMDLVAGLLTASTDTAKGASQICRTINEIFDAIQCDEYGNPRNTNMGPATYYRPVVDEKDQPVYTENINAFITAAEGKLNAKEVFAFTYDWRIDPSENAELLRQYIMRVQANTGKKKVSLISAGYGGVVANAYLYYYPDEAARDLNSCVFLDTFATGSSIVGDVMSGDITRDLSHALQNNDNIFDLGSDIYDTLTGADVGDAFARYLGSDPTGLFADIFTNMLGTSSTSSLFATLTLTLISYLIEDQGYFQKLGSGYKDIINGSEAYIYSQGLREYMRNMPGLWAIVPEDSFDRAMDYMWGKGEDPTLELQDKIDRSRKVLEATEKTVKKASLSGINVCVVAGYNLQILPITSSIKEQSDALQATRYAGMGCTTGDIKGTLKLSRSCTNGNHNHVEPGKAIDAATCFLPENTWFIRSHEHNDYKAASSAAFLVWLVNAPSQRTVWANENYPQYLQKSSIGDTVFAYSDPSDSELNEFSYGDLNLDGHIDSADARLALRYAVGLEDTPSRILNMVGDVSGNGIIDAADARLILRYAVGLDDDFSRVR